MLVGFFIVFLIFVYLIIVLFTFHPEDPGWMQLTWNGIIYNSGGILGARVSDFLFFIFGIVAYVVPFFVLFYFGMFIFRIIHITAFTLFIKLIEFLVFLLICSLITQFIFNDIFYFPSGGIIGSLLLNYILSHSTTIFYIILVLSLIIIINFFCFFNKYLKNIFLVVQKTIQYIKIIITTLISKKYNKYYRVQQAYFNVHNISSSSFSEKKNIGNRLINNLFTVNNVFCTCSYMYNKFLKLYDPHVKNKKIKTKHKSNKYAMHNSDKCCSKLFQNLPRLDINCVKNNSNTMTSTQIKEVSILNQRKSNIFNQYVKIQNNDSMNLVINKKNVYKKNTLLSRQFPILNTDLNVSFINKLKSIYTRSDVNDYTESTSKLNYHNLHDGIINSIEKRNNFDSILPETCLLTSNPKKRGTDYSKFKIISQLIEKKLLEYHITANVVKITSGPVITCFELSLSAGTKSAKISNLSRDLARSLSVSFIRIVDIIPGTPYIGLEIPNEERSTIYLKDVINSKTFQNTKSPLALVLGLDIYGKPVVEDLRSMPHLLVAGTTGSGKSVGINAMIISILYKATPEEVRFIMIDPKILELSIYSNIPHLLRKVVTNVQDAESILKWCLTEMEYRYKLMSICKVRNLEDYNIKMENFIFKKQISDKYQCLSITYKKLPYIVVIIDELSDLMIVSVKKEIEILITRLAQKARAAGIHLILSTQRPSVDVITGVIKANIPARIAFTVSSKIDSRTIIGQAGAESLLGIGDMLYLPANSSNLIRIHGPYVKDQEISSIVQFWKSKKNIGSYNNRI